jgi:integrase
MRPSELYALSWTDIFLEEGIVWLTKSRHMNSDSPITKTSASNRTITVGPAMVVNKLGEPMSKKWAEHNWAKILTELEIRHRKFYATFITAAIKAGVKSVSGSSISSIF